MQTTYITNTNYVQNPSFEVDLTYWRAISGVITRQNSNVYVGSYAAKLVTSANRDLNVLANDSTATSENYLMSQKSYQINASESTATQEKLTIGGVTYPLLGKPNVSDSTTTSESYNVIVAQKLSGYENYASIITPLPYMFTGDTYVAQSAIKAPAGTPVFIQFQGLKQSGFQQFSASGGWDIIVTAAVTADVSSFSLQIGTLSPNITMYVDAVQVEQNTAVTNYFDGSYGLGYHWYGVPNYSGSFYRAFEVEAASQNQESAFGIQISWLKQQNVSYQAFTIGTSIIGGPDFIPGSNAAIGLFGQYQYTDYSVFGYSWSIQKSIGQYPYGVMMATASVELDNNLNTFSPGVDATIGNYILPQRPITISAGYSDIGQTVNVFEGLTTAPSNDVNERLTTINAYDFMTYLNSLTSYYTPDQVNQTADQIIIQLLTEAGFSPSQYVIEPSLQPAIGYFSCYSQLMTDLVQTLCEAEQGIFFCDETGLIRFWNRQHLILNDTIQWSFNFSTITQAVQENTPIINDVVVTANPRAVQAKQNIFSLDEPFQIPAAQQIQSATGKIRNIIENPSFERDINYWSAPGAGGGYTPPTVTQASGGYSGDTTPSSFSMKSTGSYQTGMMGSTYSSPSCVLYNSSGYNNPNFGSTSSNDYPFVPGTYYTLQGRVKANAGETITCGWGWDSNYNNLTEFSGSKTYTATGGWDLVSYTWLASDVNSADYFGYGGYYYTYFTTSNTSGSSMYLDQVSLTETSSLQPYFDGGTPFTSTYLYEWESTVNESSSLLIPITTIVGTYTFTTDFDDPATSVDLPTYVNPLSTTTSSFISNLNSDNSGATYSTYINAVNPQLLGGNYTVTFQNAWQEPVFVTEMDLFGTPATVVNSIDESYSNQSSINAYGENPANNFDPLTIDNDAIQDVSTATALAYSLVLDYSNAYARITVDVIAIPQLQFGDWVSVTFDDVGQTNDYVIVGITYSDASDQGPQQTLELEVRNQVRYFTINSSMIGGTDAISP
jgi:hypothetical protein